MPLVDQPVFRQAGLHIEILDGKGVHSVSQTDHQTSIVYSGYSVLAVNAGINMLQAVRFFAPSSAFCTSFPARIFSWTHEVVEALD